MNYFKLSIVLLIFLSFFDNLLSIKNQNLFTLIKTAANLINSWWSNFF